MVVSTIEVLYSVVVVNQIIVCSLGAKKARHNL
jgi:hypothetical protein